MLRSFGSDCVGLKEPEHLLRAAAPSSLLRSYAVTSRCPCGMRRILLDHLASSPLSGSTLKESDANAAQGATRPA
jgi:hypothetical protein